MKKIILFIVLLILTVSFLALIVNAYELQKKYFESKNSSQEKVEAEVVTIKDKPSLYKDYAKEDYDLALSEKRITILYFTSNWCKECQAQDESIVKLFEELSTEGLVGLRIHILDSETTTETDAIAKKFDVTKEQTFVVLNKSGAVGFKYTGGLETDLLKQKIMEVVNK